MFYSDAEIDEAYKRSEIASCPFSEEEKQFVILHICEMCNKQYFCPCVKHPAESKCVCKNNCCYLCWWQVSGLKEGDR